MSPAAPPGKQRPALIAVAVAGLLLLLAPPALADTLTPESGGSPNADDIDTLYKIVFALGLLVFAGVEGTLIWSLVKYRHRRGAREPAQIRGNTPLEIGWTVGAAGILVVLTVITFVLLGDIKNPQESRPGGLPLAGNAQLATLGQPEPPGGRSLRIGVNGQQFLWRYDYPEREGRSVFAYHEMRVPVNTTVTLDIRAQDVIHSWWIPKLGGKADAVPGYGNETWFRISEPGVYHGVCAELCGEGHADMRAVVRAVSVAEYEAWYARQAEAIQESQEGLAAQRRARAEQAEAEEQ